MSCTLRLLCIHCTPTGRYCPVGAVSSLPIACPVGQYSTSAGAAVCTVCPQGTWYGSATGLNSSTCLGVCPVGTFSPPVVGISSSTGSGASPSSNGQCTPCPAGYYANVSGSAVCTACPVGRYGGVVALTTANCTAACVDGVVCDVGAVSAYGQRACGRGELCVFHSHLVATAALEPRPATRCFVRLVGSLPTGRRVSAHRVPPAATAACQGSRHLMICARLGSTVLAARRNVQCALPVARATASAEASRRQAASAQGCSAQQGTLPTPAGQVWFPSPAHPVARVCTARPQA